MPIILLWLISYPHRTQRWRKSLPVPRDSSRKHAALPLRAATVRNLRGSSISDRPVSRQSLPQVKETPCSNSQKSATTPNAKCLPYLRSPPLFSRAPGTSSGRTPTSIPSFVLSQIFESGIAPIPNRKPSPTSLCAPFFDTSPLQLPTSTSALKASTVNSPHI